MARRLIATMAAVLMVAGLAPAQEKAPAGTWKVSVTLRKTEETPFWLLKFEQKDGEWSGSVLASQIEDLGKNTVTQLSVKGDTLTFAVKAGDNRISFETKVFAGDADRMQGNLQFPRGMLPQDVKRTLFPAVLERTTLTSLDQSEINKDIINNAKNPILVINTVQEMVRKAGFIKAKPEDVKSWMDRAMKLSEPFGERWQREMLLELVELLGEQDGMAGVALPYARRAERMLTPKDKPIVQKRTLELLATALTRAGKADEAKEVSGRAEKIDLTKVQMQAFAGRAAKFNRVAVFELFTGSECPPCVAADLGFDGLVKTFQPKDVILLQYHEHIPGPDPLANGQTFERFNYYAKAFAGDVRGTPATLINGTPAASGGGFAHMAQEKYDQYYEALLGKLEDAAKVNLTVKATRKGDNISIDADVADLKEPGASVKLRLLLVEEEIEYKGGNGIEKHHHVVRGFAGEQAGVALKAKELKHKATIDLAQLKKKHMDDLQKDFKRFDEEVPKNVPLDYKNLRIVALVQDDNTKEILHAIQVNVTEEK